MVRAIVSRYLSSWRGRWEASLSKVDMHRPRLSVGRYILVSELAQRIKSKNMTFDHY